MPASRAPQDEVSALDPQPDQPVERRGIVEQFARRRAVHDRAALDHDRVLRQRQRDLGVLLDQDDRRALLARSCGRCAAVSSSTMIGARPFERLVEQQQRRIGHQRARDRQHLLLAAGELVAHVARAARRGAETARRRPRRSQRPGRAATVRFSSTRQRGKDLALLRHPAEPGARAAVRRHAA